MGEVTELERWALDLTAIVSLVTTAGAIVLGILYGQEAKQNALLTEQLALCSVARAKAEHAEQRLNEVLAARKRYITTLEQTLVDKASPAELTNMFNRLLKDDKGGNAD